MLSRTDETELLEPLHAGVQEDPPWSTFLTRLRQRTRSASVVLLAGSRMLFSGEPPEPLLTRADVPTPGSPRLDALRPGRVYAGEELFDPVRAAGRRRAPAFARVMRVAGGDAPGWLLALREGRDFLAGDSAVLAGLAPHLAIALETRLRIERARTACMFADAALGRAGVGWLAFDREARLVAASDTGRHQLAAAGLTGTAGRRLVGLSAAAEEALAAACVAFATVPGAAPDPIRLIDRPPLDLLAVAIHARDDTGSATMLGLLRVPTRSPARSRVIAAVFGLSNSEAQLADAIAGGATLDEAAARCGLTRETARTYSKRIFAKTGTRGQPDLVRLLLSGLAGLA